MYVWTASLAAGGIAYMCLVVAAATDISRRIIPNELVLVVMIAGVVLRLLADPWHVWISVIVFAAVIVCLGVLASLSMLGWGDVKLVAAATLLWPASQAIPLLLAIAVLGGVVAAFYFVVGYLPPATMGSAVTAPRSTVDSDLSRIAGRKTIPYAVAILAGVTYEAIVMALRCWPATYC